MFGIVSNMAALNTHNAQAAQMNAQAEMNARDYALWQKYSKKYGKRFCGMRHGRPAVMGRTSIPAVIRHG